MADTPHKGQSKVEAARDVIDAEAQHKQLALDQTILLTMERRHFQPTWNALAEGLFKWFRHQGFWPANYGPQVANSSAQDGDAYITLTRAEYTRLKKAEKIALLHSELTEMLEAVRNNDLVNEAEEAADVQVRLLDYCGGFGIDLGEGFHNKMLANYKRPHRHGKGF
jgi:NTP pyrophosphatase (non-canonical NTP hydrolase)